MKTVSLALVLCGIASTALADTLEVPPGADIQPYIDAAAPGDTIQLSEGTYTLSSPLANSGKFVIIRGVSSESTILDGNGVTSVMFGSGSLIMSDLQITRSGGTPGCGILAQTGSALQISNCILSNCQSGIAGGAIHVEPESSLTATNCVFEGNQSGSGTNGGAIYLNPLLAGNEYVISQCDFRDNAAEAGGAIYALDGMGDLDNCTFENNTSVENGGAANFGTAFIGDCTFENNQAGGEGGGLWFSGSALIGYCSFVNNSSVGTGGGIRGFQGDIANCTLNNNSAGQNGGACYLTQGGFTNCTFIGNSSTFHGGAVYTNDAMFLNCVFQNNQTGGNGGAVRYYNTLNVGGGVGISQCVFQSNSAGATGGGVAVFLSDNQNNAIHQCTFENNTADFGGGLAMSVANCYVSLSDFRTNDADESGGGIWTDLGNNCSDLTIDGGEYCGNTVGGQFTSQANIASCYVLGAVAACIMEICDTDSDGDGVLDCFDACPNDPNKTESEICGCGVAEYDLDLDSTVDCSPVYNVTNATLYDSLRSALPEIFFGDVLRMGVGAVAGESGPLFLDASNVTFQIVDPFVIPEGMLLRAGSDTRFVDLQPEGSFSVAGQLVAPNADTISFQSLEVLGNGQFLQNESLVLVNETCLTSGSGRMFLEGDIFAGTVATTGTGENRIAGNTNVFCDYENSGITIVQRGTLYIYGDLLNDGILSGDVNNGLAGGEAPIPGDGFSIAGDYTVGADASLVMPDSVWWLRVGGDLDVRIDEPSRFVMAEATIELTGLSPDPNQTLEAMSEDRGAVPAGLEPDNYPIGSIRLRPGATVEVVNQHDNAGTAGCEVVYADDLVVPAGASLVTSGCPIYVRSATIEGTVSNPEDIVIIGDEPACPTDINGDGTIDGIDLARILGAWGTADAEADVNGDGSVNGSDLALVLGDWATNCSD